MIRRIAVPAAVLILAGCSIFSRPDNQFYELKVLEPPTATASTTGAPLAIESLSLPPELERRGIVVEQENHRLEVRGTEQWAAPFEEMVLHTLALDLAARVPPGGVILPGQSKPRDAVRGIQIVIGEFDAGPETSVRLDARWTLGGVAAREQIEIPIGSLETSEVVDGMSRALAELADRIWSAARSAALSSGQDG